MPVVAAVAAEPEAVEVEAAGDDIIADDAADTPGEDVILEQEDESEGAVDLGPLPEEGRHDE